MEELQRWGCTTTRLRHCYSTGLHAELLHPSSPSQVSSAPCALCRAVTASPGMCWAPDLKWTNDLTAVAASLHCYFLNVFSSSCLIYPVISSHCWQHLVLFKVLGSGPVFKLQRCHWFQGIERWSNRGKQVFANWLCFEAFNCTQIGWKLASTCSEPASPATMIKSSRVFLEAGVCSYTSNHFLSMLRLPPGPQMCWSLFQRSPQAKARVTPCTSWQIIPEPTQWETLCRNTYRQVAGWLHVHLFGWFSKEWSPHLPVASLFRFVSPLDDSAGIVQRTSSQQFLRDLKSDQRASFQCCDLGCWIIQV